MKKQPQLDSLKFARSYGKPPSQDTPPKQELQSTLYLKLGTKVATVTAHYEHLPMPNNPLRNAKLDHIPMPTTTTKPTATTTRYANIPITPSFVSSKYSMKKEATIIETDEPIYEVLK